MRWRDVDITRNSIRNPSASRHSVALVHFRWQAFEADRDTFLISRRVDCADREAAFSAQSYWASAFQRARADFRSLQIGENTDGFLLASRSRSYQGDRARVLLLRAVGKIQPDYVHACPHQVVDHCGRTAHWTQRAKTILARRTWVEFNLLRGEFMNRLVEEFDACPRKLKVIGKCAFVVAVDPQHVCVAQWKRNQSIRLYVVPVSVDKRNPVAHVADK